MQEEKLERLLGLGRSILSQLDLDTLLEQILDVARELTGARYAAVGVLDDRREQLSRFLTSGIDAETKAVIGDLPRGRGVLGLLISRPEPLRLDDVGMHPESYGFPVGHPPMASFLGVPIMVRGEAWGNLYLTEKEGGPFDDDDERTIGVLADWAAVAVANARAYGAQRSRRDELERGKNAYEATLEISKALAGETDLDIVLELVVKRGRALVRARSVLIGLVEGDEVVVVTAAGQLDRGVIGRRLPLDGSLAGQTIRQGASKRYAGLADSLSFTLREETAADCGLFVPLLLRGRAIGVLAAFDRLEDGPQFGVEDERLMEAFATSAANAVATAQTVAVEGVQRAMHAAEGERRRWARELHDDTLQEIGALRVLLGGALQGGDPEALAEAATHAVDRLASQANVLRAMITDLHPAALDRLGLSAAIEALVSRARDQEELEVTVDADLDYEAGRDAERLSPDIELAVYRLVQEALTNVIRHAEATRVEIELVEAEGQLRVRVTDDGSGFDPEGDPAGFGLLGMRERLGLVGGVVAVESAPGAGTTVRAAVPAIHGETGRSPARLSA